MYSLWLVFLGLLCFGAYGMQGPKRLRQERALAKPSPPKRQKIIGFQEQAALNAALNYAARVGDCAVCTYLIGQGAKADAPDHSGYQAIHTAAECGHLPVIELLVQHGALVNAVASDVCPIHLAAHNGHRDVIEWLIKQGVSINTQDVQSRQPLHFAAYGGDTQTVEWLIVQGASRDARDCYLRQALHYAAMAGQLNTLSCLVVHGADINVRDNNGKRPLHYALELEKESPILARASTEWLLGHGALAGIHDSYKVAGSLLSNGILNLTNNKWVEKTIARTLSQDALYKSLETAAAVEDVSHFKSLLLSSSQKELTPATIENALYWAVLRGNDAIIAEILTLNKQRRILLSLKNALKAAVVAGRIELFESLYAEALKRIEDRVFLEDELITPEYYQDFLSPDFLASSEEALYWAVIMKNEEIVSIILACAFLDFRAAHLPLGRVRRQANRLVHRAPNEEKAQVMRIRECLEQVACLQKIAHIRPQITTSQDAAERLTSFFVALPAEVTIMILHYLLRPLLFPSNQKP